MDRQSKILLIEDSDIQRQVLEMRLKKQDIDVSSCESGELGLKFLENNQPDLVLLDLNMPGKDGLTVLKEIRESYSSLDLPVIILTSEEKPQSIISAFEAGANDYINKEVSFKIALQRIRIQLKLRYLAESEAKAKEMKALTAMIITYNHEINNPLAIAYGNLGTKMEKLTPEKFNRTVEALNRIRDLVSKIQKLDVSKVEYSPYTQNSSMLKISK